MRQKTALMQIKGTTMLTPIVFHTDSNLIINAWGEEIAKFTGKPPEMSIGRKYYEVLPLISLEGQDAVAEAVRTDNALSLKQYQIPCLFAQITADIDIELMRSAYGSIKAVKVTLYPTSTCTIAHKLNQSQQLINIGKIASSLAHGVRNPLNAIKGAVVYLREKYAGEALLTEFTMIMEEEISRLENFITKFLGSPVSITELSVTNINSLMKRIEVLTSLQFYTRNISSTYELGNIPPLVVNAFHLEQAILNVLNNSFEAMQTGGQLHIRTYTETRGGTPVAAIEISDTGPGISGAAAGNRRAGHDKETGKGFGLFITQEILSHYRGHMEIENGRERGTTVRLCLPVTQPVQEVSDVCNRESADRR